MRMHLVAGSLVLATTATAQPKPPKRCGFSVTMAKPVREPTRLAGKVATLERGPRDRGEPWQVTLDDQAATTLSIFTPLALPFAQGDALVLHAQCSGFHLVCDVRFEDPQGKILAIAATAGSDTLSAGWTSKPGRILKQRQNPNETRKSVERDHAVVLTTPLVNRMRPVATEVTATACTPIKHAGRTWLATGMAHSWDGVRPPEGFDYRSYSLVPWKL